jgi:hypothetical protein
MFSNAQNNVNTNSNLHRGVKNYASVLHVSIGNELNITYVQAE